MSININEMTLAAKKRLAAELAPLILEELRNSSEVIIPGTNKTVKATVRILDSGLISNSTHEELDAAEAAIDEATTIAGLKVAVKSVIKIFRVILMGRK